jgi:hypothetical protein
VLAGRDCRWLGLEERWFAVVGWGFGGGCGRGSGSMGTLSGGGGRGREGAPGEN